MIYNNYDAGAMGVMSIVGIAEEISMFLVKIVFLTSKIWFVGHWKRYTSDARIEIKSIPSSPLQCSQHNAGASSYCELRLTRIFVDIIVHRTQPC